MLDRGLLHCRITVTPWARLPEGALVNPQRTKCDSLSAVEDNVDVVVKNAKRGGGLGLTDYYTLPLTGDFVTITSTGTEYFHINCTGAVILAQYARTGR